VPVPIGTLGIEERWNLNAALLNEEIVDQQDAGNWGKQIPQGTCVLQITADKTRKSGKQDTCHADSERCPEPADLFKDIRDGEAAGVEIEDIDGPVIELSIVGKSFLCLHAARYVVYV
jgi:hypothetical protein